MQITNRIPGRTAFFNNEAWLYFSGTSYLGLSQNTDFQNLILEGIHQYGAHFGGSRLSNLRLAIFEQAENALVTWTGAAAALTVSSGTLAGQLVVKSLEQRGKFYFAPGVHPALFGEGTYFNADFADWTSFVLAEAQRSKSPLVLLCNTIDALKAKSYDLKWIEELPNNIPITLVLDDSHGIGITGKNGAGIFTTLQVPENVELIVIASLGKALSIPGGVILGSQPLIQNIWQSPYFGGASPITPAYLHAFLHAKTLYQQQREQLLHHIHHFTAATTDLDLFETFNQFPVFYTRENILADFLSHYKVLISSFPYPTAQSERITRIVLNAAHSEEDIVVLIDLLKRFINLRNDV
ncbi:MAG: aminotransferase class I/II-fold pyridoxal phosphate-dependent enzyme [Saprospiraceae bacterium]